MIRIFNVANHEMLNGLRDTAYFRRDEVNLRDRILFMAVNDMAERCGILQFTHDSGVYPGNVGIGYRSV